MSWLTLYVVIGVPFGELMVHVDKTGGSWLRTKYLCAVVLWPLPAVALIHMFLRRKK